ncbi:hypothetical protein QQF64_018763 [Cirrhinus molitorella]|uniref:Uncharacterized protein n=1 Tax=Cirrhinus molitorella TaxID=172907 RepID=A0ABR3LDJ6_9TELE
MCSESEAKGKAKVLDLADIAESTFSQAISPELWKILGNMQNDDVSAVVRNDFLILQFSQCLYHKHGSDPTKSVYIRQKVREMGRLLLSLRRKAIATEDDDMAKAAERFKRLCSSEWAEHVSNATLESKFNHPSTVQFTQDVQLLHQYLEDKSAEAFESLRNHESSQTYAELAKVTLAQVIMSNRCCAGKVSKMTLECFKKRDQTELHEDMALGLSPFEQNMSKHFSRVEIMGNKGRNVAILLNPELVRATELIVEKRAACEVDKDNPFLFGRPKCKPSSFFRGQDCVRLFASQCGAKNPGYLKSTQLCKQVATISQILHLKDNEPDQLANFLGHDIRVDRDYYRTPDATIEIAKISKLLLAKEKGNLARFRGKSLDEIEIEDEIDLELDEEETSDEDDEESDPAHAGRGM